MSAIGFCVYVFVLFVGLLVLLFKKRERSGEVVVVWWLSLLLWRGKGSNCDTIESKEGVVVDVVLFTQNGRKKETKGKV
jgi:hypothetical protein